MSETEQSTRKKTQWSFALLLLFFAMLQQEQQREHKLTHDFFTKSYAVIADDILLDG